MTECICVYPVIIVLCEEKKKTKKKITLKYSFNTQTTERLLNNTKIIKKINNGIQLD